MNRGQGKRWIPVGDVSPVIEEYLATGRSPERLAELARMYPCKLRKIRRHAVAHVELGVVDELCLAMDIPLCEVVPA